MRKTYRYRVADHLFAVSIPQELLAENNKLMAAYRPFETEEMIAGDETDGQATGEVLFHLDIMPTEEVALPADFAEETRQTEDGQTIVSGQLANGRKAIAYDWDGRMAFVESSADYASATLHTTAYRLQNAVDNTLMLLFAFATAPQQTLLFHSSTVVWQDKGYMFLGVSGTGKSTHSRLWLKNIPNTHLLNDDNPVVRISPEGMPIVYGSPWSGKTPCYKNEQYPVGAIVMLHQAPANDIRQANVLEGYVAITESVSGKRWEKSIADGLHATTDAVLKGCKVFLLGCLPDDDAAKVCWNCVTSEKKEKQEVSNEEEKGGEG